MDLKWNGDELVKKVEAEMSRRLKVCTVLLQRAVKTNISKSQRSSGYSKPGHMPHADTGRLRNSIFQAVDGLTGVVGVPKNMGVVYGRFLEEGHTYYPRSKSYMAVPISPEAKRYRRTGASVRNFPIKLTPIYRKGKPTLLVEKRSKRKWVIHYILLTKATVAPRPFLAQTMEQNLAQISSILGAPLS